MLLGQLKSSFSILKNHQNCLYSQPSKIISFRVSFFSLKSWVGIYFVSSGIFFLGFTMLLEQLNSSFLHSKISRNVLCLQVSVTTSFRVRFLSEISGKYVFFYFLRVHDATRLITIQCFCSETSVAIACGPSRRLEYQDFETIRIDFRSF